jgi:DNA-binding NtrC family response regulator
VLGNWNGNPEDKITMQKKILVVEDHGVLLELLGKGLTLRGWDTILAGSGVEALKKLEDYLPNVIRTGYAHAGDERNRARTDSKRTPYL